MKRIYLFVTLLICPMVVMASRNIADIREQLRWVNITALQMAVADMEKHQAWSASSVQDKLNYIITHLDEVKVALSGTDSLQVLPEAEKILSFQRAILLSNPLLDADKLLVTRFALDGKARSSMATAMCMPPGNYMGLMDAPRTGYQAEICLLSNLQTENVTERILYKPLNKEGVADVQLHWDADRFLFVSSTPALLPSNDTISTWQIFEMDIEGKKLRQVTKVEEPDLEFTDPCYLPDGRIMLTTNIGYNGIPCENGLRVIHNLALYDPANSSLRKIAFDQDGNWSPSVLNNGRVMYTRWEYTDLTHYFSRIVMHANPDGTETKALYGSGSYWPNSIFDMQQLPGPGSRFVGIVTGHHGVSRSGRLFLFDPAKGRKEEKGVMQEIPYRGRTVVPEIKDYLVDGVWPQFTRPFPLNENYFVVSAKLHKDGLWGIYLVDVFDNVTLIAETEGLGYITPLPVKKRTTPPAIPDRIKPGEKEATVFIQDLYEGEGLRNVPRGTIKSLRVFTYEYAYLNSPSDFDAQGIQSGWDIKRELGTVEVESDGSVIFTIPANTPVSLQSLDENGAAVQWMRSWFTAMPGELVSCIGCHEDQNTIPVPKRVQASLKHPEKLTPPTGGIRPFAFETEIQPVLDKYCISCHDGISGRPYFKGDKKEIYKRGVVTPIERHYLTSYLNLHPYVYRQGPEADMYVLRPYEYHASNSDLIQVLDKGHHGVVVDAADLQTLYKWIDLNAPYFGSFEIRYPYHGFQQYDRRRALLQKYGGTNADWQKELADYAETLRSNGSIEPVIPEKKADKTLKTKILTVDKQAKPDKIITLPSGHEITLVWIPGGSYQQWNETTGGKKSEKQTIRINKGFWMGKTEITNAQYNTLNPEHDSRFIGQQWKDHTTPGYPANQPEQPVVRVSWDEVNDFCKLLQEKTGQKVSLPTRQQWEWACRAGTSSDMWYGSAADDYGQFENMADQTLSALAVMGVDPKPMPANYPLRKFWDFVPRDSLVNDGQLLSVAGGQYRPNPWGLYDMHGNVAEWTASDRNDSKPDVTQKVVCGGSWRDRSSQSTANQQRYYKSWQAPFNVGFRICIEE